MCRLRYPSRNAHAPYCHMWPSRLYNLYIFFPHYLIKAIFSKKKVNLLNRKCVFWFSVKTFLQNISRSKKNRVRYDQKIYFGLHVILVRFEWNLNFLDIFSKNQISRIFVRWDKSCTIRTDGRAQSTGRKIEIKKLIVSSLNFLNWREENTWEI
jgi:hypothetical protein